MPQKSKLLKTLLVTSLTSGVSLTLPMVEIYAAVSKMTGDANIGTTYSDGLHPAFNNVQHFEDSNDIEVNQSSTLNILNSHGVNIGSIKINGPKTDVTIKPADATVKLGPIRGTGSASMDISSSLIIFSLRPRDKGKGQDKVYSALKEIKFSDRNHKKSTIHITTSASFDSPIIAAKDTNGEIVIQADVKLKQPITTHNKDIDIAIFKEPWAKKTQLTLSADNALITPSMGNINFNFGDPRTILSINGKDTTITGNIANGNNGTLNVLATLTTTTPTITTIQNTNIENNVDFNIDSINSNIDLLGNSTQIIFKGENSELGLINTSNANDRQFSLYANLNPSNASDNYGIVRIGAFTNGLTIANKNGPFTIGQDNTHRLKEFIVHGRGNIIIDNMVFTKLLRMDSTSQVTFNQALDLGDGGNIVFRLDSTLVVNGVKGNIITSKNGRGTLTIHSGNVSGTIGDDKKSLKLINIGANPVKFSANVFSPVALTDNSSVLILADDVKLTGAVTTQNNMQGILSLGAGSSVTGQIGANDTVLDKVRVGAKASCLSGVVYAGAVELTDKTSVLMLQNDAVINGNITTSVGNTSGKLIFTKNGMVTGNVGVISEILFNGVDKIQGTANVTTFTVGDAAADATVTGLMTGDVVYTAAGELTAMNGLKGDVDFKNNAGTFVLGDGATITGVVTSTGGRAGTLNFAGNARVTKGIGTNADNSPALISVQGDGKASVALDDDIFVGGINFINGGKLGFNGNLTTPNIDFGVNGGTLEFRAGNPYTLSSTIANGGNGVLNVLTTVTATDPTIGTVKTINIGEVGTPQIFIIQVNNPNLAVNSNINLLNAGSQLTITVPQDQTITFVNSVKGVVGGGA